ncbi:MAG: triose-phosphate isomerase [Candidatus Portnoybacteria bacterium]|nr:triose-phosphate isomerase [Candidatus Portnoybacteria bacterium]
MKLIIANWKMNPDNSLEAKELFRFFDDIESDNEVVICPPFAFLGLAPERTVLGGQNCFWKKEGSFTGEVSPLMLKDMGCRYVIIGHSERRDIFGENNEIINKKIKAVLEAGIIPILCVGEKKGDNANRVVVRQLEKGLEGIDSSNVIIAYEPVWAIGTGDFCSPEKADEIRKIIKEKVKSKILYGGSVNSKNVKSYIDKGFDGVLVGGASLKKEEFVSLVKNA